MAERTERRYRRLFEPLHRLVWTWPRARHQGMSRRELVRERATLLPRYLRSLLDSMSNHIAKRVNWRPEITSNATRTTVAMGIE
jgi:hypothetical protein